MSEEIMNKPMGEQQVDGVASGTGIDVKNETKFAQSAPSNASAPMTLAAVRQELKAIKGKRYWQSVDELANSAEFQAAVDKEFPSTAPEWVDPVSRRGFMKLMGAAAGRAAR